MKELVRLRTRPSRDGRRFTYMLDYVDENGKRRRTSLGHADKRRAERQRVQRERELRMGIVAPESTTLSEFLVDSRLRTGDQVRESTHYEYGSAMEQFIEVVGNIDFQKVRLSHGELFRQTCLDKGNTPATVGKKLRSLKRLFQLGVRRGQLQENPLKYLDEPKWSKRKVEIYKPGEIERILKAARYHREPLRWDLLIYTALVTALRRGELLNATWRDVDFEAKTIDVSPKQSTPETWRWLIKDTDRRTLPLTDELVAMLAKHISSFVCVWLPVCAVGSS